MRILRPFSAYVAKFTIWPEEAIYLLKHANPKCLPRIASTETLQAAADLMTVRGDVSKMREVIMAFRAHIDLNTTFAVAAEHNQISRLSVISSFTKISDNTKNCALYAAIISVNVKAARVLLAAEALPSIGFDEFIRNHRITKLNFIQLHGSCMPDLSKFDHKSKLWVRAKYVELVRAIESGHMDSIRAMRLSGFTNSRLLICQALRTGSAATIDYLINKRHEFHVHLSMFADNIYLCNDCGIITQIFETIIRRRNGFYGKFVANANLTHSIRGTDVRYLADKLRVLFKYGAEDPLIRNWGAEKNKIVDNIVAECRS